jgi:hypothetical protein
MLGSGALKANSRPQIACFWRVHVFEGHLKTTPDLFKVFRMGELPQMVL